MLSPILALILLASMRASQSNDVEPQAHEPRGKVLGIGGVFFKSPRPKELTQWYEKHLGFHADPRIGVVFPWRAPADAQQKYRTTWAVFPRDTRYFEPSKSELMVNYIVDDLDAMLARLGGEGVKIDPKRETDEAGRFAWVYDSDGNKIELWEPAKSKP